MTTEQLFSFVIPVHNGEGTLAACLESIIAQTYGNAEIIVVDNASTDNTKKIANSYDDVRYIYEPNLGRSYARNCGAMKSQSKYICFIDCDVELDKNWLLQCDNYLKNRPIDFLATSVLPVGEKDSVVDSYRHFFADWKSHSTFLSVRKRRMFFPVINTSACVVLKESLSEVGFFDEELKRNEDLDLSIRFFLQGFLLGATSKAQARVQFKGRGSPMVKAVDYLKREIDVHKDSLFPSRIVQLIYLETIFNILKSSRPKRLKLACFGGLLFLCGNLGSLINKFKVRGNFKDYLVKYPPKRGNSTYHTSYELDGELLLIKSGVTFLFYEETILYSKDFNSMGLVPAASDLKLVLEKIFEHEKITNEDRLCLQDSGLFITVPL